ncbi:hypothetical protein [Aridibaculum aurantiacum]|uniref:hypothetical protein n=1 Tax=Aridibaculum aurantiacum TaxID=2810307 RepID=UPI001A95918B|nr:hypothetical protein [Aridibaculum aurantiacum]
MHRSYAQEPGMGSASLSAGLELALPTGDLKTGAGIGLGASLKTAFPVIPYGDVTVSAGYLRFSGKEVTLPLSQQSFAGQTRKTLALGAIPLKAGFRYRFPNAFYVEPQVGYTLFSMKGYQNEGAFTYVGSVGVVLLRNMLDVGLRYEAATKENVTLSHVGLRTAYNIAAKRR